MPGRLSVSLDYLVTEISLYGSGEAKMSIVGEGRSLVKFAKAMKNYKESDTKSEKQMAAQHLAEMMGDERGLILKIGQLMGSSKDSLEEFQSLLKVPKMALSYVQIVGAMESYLGVRWDDLFESFSEVGVAASLAQVHRARLKTGEVVAVKIQIPGLDEALKAQMKLFGLIPTIGKYVGPQKKWGIDFEIYQKLFNANFKAELDYQQEAENQFRFFAALSHFPGVRVPKVVGEIRSSKILMSEWVEGKTFNDFLKQATEKEKLQIADRLLGSFLYLFFTHGYVQADYNEGNFLIDENSQLVMLDFGSCYQFSKEYRMALASLISTLRDQKPAAYRDYFCALGFDDKKTNHLESELPWIGQIVFEPFLRDRQSDLTQWEVERRLTQLLGESKWWFRSAGGADFFILMKAFSGLVRLIEQLGVPLNFGRAFDDATAGWKAEIDQYIPPSVPGSENVLREMAKSIEISVFENGMQNVNVVLPGKALVDLPDYIDEELRKKISAGGVNVDELVRKAISSGARPQVLFEMKSGSKNYRVELRD